MSATNRGIERIHKDQYDTPDWLIQAILPYIMPTNSLYSNFRILEPACGTGAVVNVIKDYPTLYPIEVDAYDVESRGCGEIRDFITGIFDKKYDLIITNPPFYLAFEFVTKALSMRRSTCSTVALLLRLNWLASQGRASWMRENTPSIYITPRRPMFRLNKNGKKGSDACEYAWFVWGPYPPIINILKTEK